MKHYAGLDVVVRNPRCEPIGYPTDCRMLNQEPAQRSKMTAPWRIVNSFSKPTPGRKRGVVARLLSRFGSAISALKH